VNITNINIRQYALQEGKLRKR